MGKINKYRRGIAGFINSEKGQRFFNFAYSIGAAIVIWGALFKILHLPGGNALLSIGMGTEVLMFVLTAFDRPPKDYKWEDVFPALKGKEDEDSDKKESEEDNEIRPELPIGDNVQSGPVYVGPTVIYGGGGGSGVAPQAGTPAPQPTVTPEQARNAVGIPAGVELSASDTMSLTESIAKMSAAADQLSKMAELTSATQTYLEQMAAISEEMQQLRETTTALNNVGSTLLKSYEAITENSENISTSSQGYVDQMLGLNRNISGLNAIYELQLKSVSSQIESIERVNRGIKDIRDMYEKSASQSARYCEETDKMARYMQQLNSIYERMVTAMTVNMYQPGMMPPTTNVPENPATPSV